MQFAPGNLQFACCIILVNPQGPDQGAGLDQGAQLPAFLQAEADIQAAVQAVQAEGVLPAVGINISPMQVGGPVGEDPDPAQYQLLPVDDAHPNNNPHTRIWYRNVQPLAHMLAAVVNTRWLLRHFAAQVRS